MAVAVKCVGIGLITYRRCVMRIFILDAFLELPDDCKSNENTQIRLTVLFRDQQRGTHAAIHFLAATRQPAHDYCPLKE